MFLADDSMPIRSLLLSALRALGWMRVINRVALLWYGAIKKWAQWRGTEAIDAIYNPRFFKLETEMTAPTAAAVVECLLAEFRPASVADVGCGTGVYLREFAERGMEIRGYDGSRHAIDAAEIAAEKIVHGDLTEPLRATERFDLVICFEVAEHLPAKRAQRFVENLTSLGETVAFSAAKPGQGGADHCNEQPSEYWIGHFARRGFTWNSPRTERLRTELRRRRCVWWLGENLLVFEKVQG